MPCPPSPGLGPLPGPCPPQEPPPLLPTPTGQGHRGRSRRVPTPWRVVPSRWACCATAAQNPPADGGESPRAGREGRRHGLGCARDSERRCSGGTNADHALKAPIYRSHSTTQAPFWVKETTGEKSQGDFRARGPCTLLLHQYVLCFGGGTAGKTRRLFPCPTELDTDVPAAAVGSAGSWAHCRRVHVLPSLLPLHPRCIPQQGPLRLASRGVGCASRPFACLYF